MASKRTRKWQFVAQEATRLAAMGLSPREIARHVGVDYATAKRWFQTGRLTRAKCRPPASAGAAGAARAWSDLVRKGVTLDATDEQLVALGEAALTLAHDVTETPATRLMATARFQSISKQLALGKLTADLPPDSPPAPRRPRTTRPAVDPRRLFTVN